jgi:hypothetical protein
MFRIGEPYSAPVPTIPTHVHHRHHDTSHGAEQYHEQPPRTGYRVIGADETQEIKEREASPKQKKYRRFFGEVLEHFKQELPGVTSRSAGGDSWLTIPAGHSDIEFLWHFKGDPGDKELHVVMNFQFDDSARNEELLDTMLAAIEDRSLDVPEEIHSEEYGSSGYTRLYVKREVGRLDDALENEELKEWAVDSLVEFHEQLTPVLDEELR